MHKEESAQSKSRTGNVILVITAIFLTTLMTTCGSGETQNENKSGTAPVSCNGCANLQIVLDKQSYAQNEPITVTAIVSVLNDAHLTSPYYASPMKNFRVSLVDEWGQSVPLTEKGSTEKWGPSFRMPMSITRDHPFEETFRIDNWFELSEPGTYTLTVTKNVRNWTPVIIKVIGNPIVFTRLP